MTKTVKKHSISVNNKTVDDFTLFYCFKKVFSFNKISPRQIISVDKYNFFPTIFFKSRSTPFRTSSSYVFYSFLPASYFLRLKGAGWLSFAINLFAPLADSRPKQTKSLQNLAHFGFYKTILAIPKLSTFIFASTKAKINKLNCLPAFILRPP